VVSVENLEGNGPLERLRRKREDNIKMEFTDAILNGRDKIGLVPDRQKWLALVDTVMSFSYNEGTLKGLINWRINKKRWTAWS
jgi:hypothetical protein